MESIFRFEGNGGIKEHPGNYTAYLEARERDVADDIAPSVPKPSRRSGKSDEPRRLSYKERREFEELEKRIELTEARKGELERVLAVGSSDFVSVEAAYKELQSVTQQLEKDVDRWATLAELA